MKAPAKTNAKPKFPLNRLLAAHAAMQQLDGYERVVTEEGKERAVRVPYHFAAAAYMPLARARIVLDLLAATKERARNALIVSRAPEGCAGAIQQKDHPEAFAAVAGEIAAMLEAEEAIDLPAIPLDHFRLEDNPIPLSALVPLMSVGIVVG